MPEPAPDTAPAGLLDEERVGRWARALAADLARRGLAPGARIALLCGNSAAFVAARDAVTAAGRVLSPINPRLAPPEVAHILSASGAALLWTDPRLAAAAERAAATLPAARRPPITVLDRPPEIEDDHLRIGPLPRRGRVGVGGRVTPRAKVAGTGPMRDPRAIGATLLYTSGTTGQPKGCLRSAEQESARAFELVATYQIGADDVHLVVCPLAHSAPGIFLRACRAVGARTAVGPRFSPESFLAAVERVRATLFFLVPTQYERLLALPEAARARRDLSSVRAAIVAGAPIAPATKARLVDWLGPDRLWEFYGSSETGTVTVLPPAEQLSRPGSVGRPPPGVELRVLGPDGVPAAPGQVGEIYVRSPAMMSGYLEGDRVRMPDTPLPGFFSVGDLGQLDANGYLYLVDRKHDTIISGGVNVYPAEVERALSAHPDVEGAVVFGAPDPDWGQIVAAAVAPRPGARVDGDALRAFLREHIAAFKLPRALALMPVDELPLGASGKPLRRRAAAALCGSPRLVRID